MEDTTHGLQVELPDGTTIGYAAPRDTMTPEAIATYLRAMVTSATLASVSYWRWQKELGMVAVEPTLDPDPEG